MKKIFKMNLKKKIITISVFPIVLLGAIVILVALTLVKGALLSEIEMALQSAATATFAAYDQNAGDYLEAKNGDIWKGSYNISKSENLVDSISEKSNIEVTFFYGDKRIMTSAKDKDGNRVLGSPAGDKIKKIVLEEGKEYFSKTVSIEGTMYYGYYVPVVQEGADKPVGMIFVGAKKAAKDAAIDKMINFIIVVIVLAMLCCIIAGILFSMSITGSLKKSIGSVQSVATGDLKGSIDQRLLRREDEIGDLSRAIMQLQGEMTKSIETIAQNADAVLQSSKELGDTAQKTTISMSEVERAVNSIAQSASHQADISGKASENVNEMGQKIERTSREMAEMERNTQAMRDSEEKTVATLQRLLAGNEEVQQLIQEIAKQTKKTNESAQKINEVTQIIASIAEETNLLSLNASIEAARAGESGKGFAVVASQIQKLANQSNESSQGIEEIVHMLISDSDHAVQTMEKVTQTISIQTNNMKETERMTKEVMQRLQDSMDSMQTIENSISYLDGAGKDVTGTVEELFDIARQNAATTQQVCAAANMVTENFGQIEGSTKGLKSIADGLEESMEHFRV